MSHVCDGAVTTAETILNEESQCVQEPQDVRQAEGQTQVYVAMFETLLLIFFELSLFLGLPYALSMGTREYPLGFLLSVEL